MKKQILFKMRRIILLQLILFISIGSFSQDNCGNVSLNNAKKKYDNGNFQSVIDILAPCIQNDFDQTQRAEAYRLTSLTYLAMDSLNKSNDAAVLLLKLKPNFEPNLFDPPRFVKMIRAMKKSGAELTITSVSKKAENVLEAPATVVVITAEDIINRGYTDLEALFSDIPGIDISRTYGITYSNIYQRGYRSSNTDRTLFLIDGMEDTDLWSNISYLAKQYPITNVKRVEIIYGPASTMYGANALVGVVNVVTKEADELCIDKPLAVIADAGLGTYNTKYADVTVATKKNNISFLGTFRSYSTNEMNLSEYPEFDYDPAFYDGVDYSSILGISANANLFARDSLFASTTYFSMETDPSTGDTTAIHLTPAGEEAARNHDKDAFSGNLNGAPVEYSNIADHLFFYGKLKISNFTIGYLGWKSVNGNANYYHDNKRMGAANGSVWVQQQSTFYVKYAKDISDKISISNHAQYRMTEIDDETRTIEIMNYSNKGVDAVDLLYNNNSYYNDFHTYVINRQFRDEFKATYSSEILDIVSGLELRNSFIQGDYMKTYSTTLSAMEDGKNLATQLYVENGIVRKTIVEGPQKPGSNYYNIFDAGLYLQGTWKYKDLLRVTLGGRVDYNRIRINGGYGFEFNPRVALVYTPGKLIIKAIYASAFQNASIYKKFSTTSRRMENPALEPEKVRNLELGLAYKFSKNLFADVVAFYSSYSNVAGVVSGLELPDGKSQQYRGIGALNIFGIQSTLTYKVKNYQFFANYTYTNPQNNILDNGDLTDEYIRIADIAEHKANMGVNARYFKKLNINLRVNMIGRKPVGENTTVPANPGDFPPIYLLDGTIGYFNIIKGLNIQLIVNNILDLEHFDPGIRSANVSTYAYRIPQPGRTITLRIFYNF